MYKELLEKAIDNCSINVFNVIREDISEPGSPLKFLTKEFSGLDSVSSMLAQSMLSSLKSMMDDESTSESLVSELSAQELSDAAATQMAKSSIDFMSGGGKNLFHLVENLEVFDALKELAKVCVAEEVFLALRELGEHFDEGSLRDQRRGDSGSSGISKNSTFFTN